MAAKAQVQDTPDKRVAALQATLELIAEQGLQDTPMSQVAERANIGVGTIYRYFSNKDDLINALYIDIKSQLARAGIQGYSPDVPPPDALKLILRNVIFYFLAHPPAFWFIEQYENSPQITAATREEGVKLAEPIEDFFKRATAAGLLKDLPVELLGALMSGAVTSLTKLYLTGSFDINDGRLEPSLSAIWDLLKK